LSEGNIRNKCVCFVINKHTLLDHFVACEEIEFSKKKKTPCCSTMADSTQSHIDATLVDKETTWKSLGLDSRLLRAIDNLHWTNPSLVQSKSIPMALKGMLS